MSVSPFATLGSEWIKLRTLRMNWVLGLISLLFPIVMMLLIALLSSDAEFTVGSEIAETAIGLTIVPVFLMAAASTISITSEFTYNTIRPTYAATPNRAQVLFAKLMTNSIAALAIITVAVFGSFSLGWSILSTRGAQLSLAGAPGAVPAMLSLCALAVIVTWFGFAIGLLIRNSPAAVVLVLLWPLLIEGLVGLALDLAGFDGALEWMPYQAGLANASVFSDPDALGRPGGLIYFGAFASALFAIGLAVNARRDA